MSVNFKRFERTDMGIQPLVSFTKNHFLASSSVASSTAFAMGENFVFAALRVGRSVVVVAMNTPNLEALADMREMLTFVFNNITSCMTRFCYFINGNMTIAAMFEADYSNQTDSQPRDVYQR